MLVGSGQSQRKAHNPIRPAVFTQLCAPHPDTEYPENSVASIVKNQTKVDRPLPARKCSRTCGHMAPTAGMVSTSPSPAATPRNDVAARLWPLPGMDHPETMTA